MVREIKLAFFGQNFSNTEICFMKGEWCSIILSFTSYLIFSLSSYNHIIGLQLYSIAISLTMYVHEESAGLVSFLDKAFKRHTFRLKNHFLVKEVFIVL